MAKLNSGNILKNLNNVSLLRERVKDVKGAEAATLALMAVLVTALGETLAAEAGGGIEDGLSPLEAALMRSHQKIPAIKEYRSRTGSGLAEAKHAVEQWANRNGVTKNGTFANPPAEVPVEVRKMHSDKFARNLGGYALCGQDDRNRW